ncbi:MAG TPA: FG-GAP-like repeat-containing protein [Gammaproteobacteria bacterium]|nr:FG-GAP-like repeat-containing protein [Gammaproteobacteria bacterium]
MSKRSIFKASALPLMTVALALLSAAAFAAAPPSLYPGQILPRSSDTQGPYGLAPYGIAQMVAADFNGDGMTDLAQTDWWSVVADNDGDPIAGGVWVYLRNAEGGYGTPVFYATAPQPYGLAAADLNGDGKLDLVTGSNASTSTAQLSVLIGNGDGSFQAHQDYTVDGSTSFRTGLVAVGDVTGDGALDVVAVTGTANIYVVPVNTDGSLDTASVQTLTQGSAANNLYNLALTDINGDGTLDIVTDDASHVNVFYGQATLAATPDQQVSVASPSPNIAAGDFNEDGYADIVESDVGRRYLQLLLNQGGKLTDPVPTHLFPVDVGAWGTISVADVDGDGHLDLFVDDDYCHGDSSYILYGSGDGTFTDPAPVPAGVCGYTTATVAAGTGLRNLLTGSWWWDAVVTEARNLGDRKFYTYARYPYATADADGTVHGFSASDMAVADFDGNGRPDLVTADAGDHSFSLLLSGGEGGFKAPVVQALSSLDGIASIAAADIDGDGNADVIVPSDNGVLYVWRGDGAGGFASPETNTSASGTVQDIAIGDINGDGKPDAVLAAWGAGQAQICMGDGTGKFNCSGSETVTQPFGVALADLNGDGNADLVVSSNYNPGSGYSTYVYTGDGTGKFTSAATLATTTVMSDGTPRYDAPRGIAIGDVNGDGKPDLIVGTSGAAAYLFEGKGDGTFGAGAAITTDLSSSGNPEAVALDDVNGDGMLDVIAGNNKESTVAVVLGYGDGTFNTPLVYASGTSNAGVAVVDVDGDDQPDIVALNRAANDVVSSTVSVYLHNHAPAVKSLNLKTTQDTAVTGTLEVADPELNRYTLAIAAKPVHGTVSGLHADSGAFTYTPAVGYSGTDSFTVTASDGLNTSAATAVNVTIQAATPPDDGSGDSTGDGSDSGSGNSMPAPGGSGGGGAFGFLTLFALGLPLLRKWRRS